MLSSKLLSAAVDEALSLSECTPDIVSSMREILINHLDTHTVMATDHYPDAIDVLYNMNDNKMYSIVSLSFVDEYLYFVILAEDLRADALVRNFVNNMKASRTLLSEEIGVFVRSITSGFKVFHEIMGDSTRTTRRAVGTNNIEVAVLPSDEVLKAFYECGRKTAYSSSEAVLQDLNGENQPYLCKHCGLYHQGKEPTGQSIPEHIMQGRHRTAWRRYYNV